MIRTYKFRLYPTEAQQAQLVDAQNVCRAIWNLALEQRQTWGRSHGINFVSQCRELTELRAQHDWIRAVPRRYQTEMLRTLEKAFEAFFRGKSRYPEFKCKKESPVLQAYTDGWIKRRSKRMAITHIPGVGRVKTRMHRDLPSEARSMSVIQNPLGWFVLIYCEVEPEGVAGMRAAGLDLGIAKPVMLSDGSFYMMPERLKRAEDQARKAQRALMRKRVGSKRREEALANMASARARVKRIRDDWHHRVSSDIAEKFGFVAMEDLSPKQMSRSAKGVGRRAKTGLNRSIRRVGWAGLADKIAYKVEGRGGAVVLVDPRNTSRTCAACGVVDAKSRKSQARFECGHCGHKDNADRNAAINILNRANRPGVEDVALAAPVKRGSETKVAGGLM